MAGTGSLTSRDTGAPAVGSADAQRVLHVELWAFAPVLMDVRTRLPMAQLDSHPLVNARAHTAPFVLPDLPTDAPKIVIAQRPGRYPEPDLRRWLAATLARGWLPVLETDDHPGLMAAVEGRAMDDLDWLSARGMAAVQTSTRALAEALAAHNPEVRVFPNAVFDLPPFDDAPRPPRVFYGAVGRGPIAADVADALAPAIRAVPDLEFVVVGDRAVFDALPTARKRFEDYAPYARYLELMGGCAATLSPLAGGPFEATKSDAKFLDAASQGTVMVASPAVYEDAIRHGQTGFIARTLDDWPRLLLQALAPDSRAVARRAWEVVRDGRMFADQIADRRDWYLDLWARRAELERGICARLPGLAEDLRRLRG